MYGNSFNRRRFLTAAGFSGLAALTPISRAFGSAPAVLVGLDAEFMDQSSTADDAIQLGAQVAIDEINERGGVLGGRPLQLVTTDNRSVPARGVANVKVLAAKPDIVAYLGGKFSPVVLEQLPHIHTGQLPLLAAWSAADAITNNRYRPNYAFRVGLYDHIVMERLVSEVRRQGLRRVGLMAPQTAWGRGFLARLEQRLLSYGGDDLSLSGVAWHYWGGREDAMKAGYLSLVANGAEAIILVANEIEGASLIREMADQPLSMRRPVFSHWGITGGRFADLCGARLQDVELVVAQSFSFAGLSSPASRQLAARGMEHFAEDDPLSIPSMTGIGPAYDLIHMLRLAIETARTAQRPAVREALEHLPAYSGVVKDFRPAFTADRHDALRLDDVLLCQFDANRRLNPLAR